MPLSDLLVALVVFPQHDPLSNKWGSNSRRKWLLATRMATNTREDMAKLAFAGFLCWLLLSHCPMPAWADGSPSPEAYRCDGEPLTALLVKGPMDEPAIPDPSTGPVPIGGNVVLGWRGLSLQLPRTNNAGPASFSDGKWWWSLEDPAHPRFRLRRPLGDIQDFSCERASS